MSVYGINHHEAGHMSGSTTEVQHWLQALHMIAVAFIRLRGTLSKSGHFHKKGGHFHNTSSVRGYFHNSALNENRFAPFWRVLPASPVLFF